MTRTGIAVTSVAPPQVVVMGPSGSGKTAVGSLLAARLGVAFLDADELHPAENIRKMSAGQPLDDTDRWPWLARVGRAIGRADDGVVMACSALRRGYRDRIRAEAPAVQFFELVVTAAELRERLAIRPDHFMPAALLDSQLATLEPLAGDEFGARIEVRGDAESVVDAICRVLTD